VVANLGGDRAYMSRGAKVAEQKAQALLKTHDSVRWHEARGSGLNAIENLVIAETKDRADWQLPGHLARGSGDSKLRDVLKPAVDEVEPEDDQHLSWTAEQMAAVGYD